MEKPSARIIDFKIKEAVIIPKEVIDSAQDHIVLRVPVGSRDALVRFDIPGYVSGFDGRSLFEIIIDGDIPRFLSDAYPEKQ